MLSKVKSTLGKKNDIVWNVIKGTGKRLDDVESYTKTEPLTYPCPRCGHSAVRCGNLMLVFGGMSVEGEYLSDFYSFDYFSKNWNLLRWREKKEHENNDNANDNENKPLKGNERVGRAYHSAIVFMDDGVYRMLVFGGKNKFFLNDLWEIDSEQFTWNRLEYCTNNANISKPSLRYGHTAVYRAHNGSKSMWVFGGYDSLGLACNDLYEYDIDKKEWKKMDWKEKLQDHENLLPSRYFHTAVMFEDAMYVFGGKGDKGALSDFKKFDFALMKWVPVECSGSAPSARWNHAAAIDLEQGLMFIHGGYNEKGVLSDLYSYHFEASKTWTYLKTKPELWQFHHTLSTWGSELFSFGGKTEDKMLNMLIHGVSVKQHHYGWESLPAELGLQIFSEFSLKDLLAVGTTCKRWHNISEMEELWRKFYVQIAKNDVFRYYEQICSQEEAYFSALPSKAKLIEVHKRKKAQLSKVKPKFHKKPIMDVKIVVVGSGAVGKTSLCRVAAGQDITADDYYYYGHWDNWTSNQMINGLPCSYTYWDTAGQEDYDRLRPLSYPETDIFIVMYSVVQPASYEEAINKFIAEINHHCPGTPFVFLANKIDLLKDEQKLQDMRNKGLAPVNEEEARETALSKGALAYFRMSCWTKEGYQAMHDLVMQFALYGVGTKPSKSSKCPIQ